MSPCCVTGSRHSHNAKVHIWGSNCGPKPAGYLSASRKDPVYLDPVWLDQVHVESRRVGQNLPTSLHRAQDVRPHFFGQLHDGGFDDFPWLGHRHLAAFRAVSGGVASVRGRLRRSHVSVLTARLQSAGAGSSDSSGGCCCCMGILWSLGTAWEVVSQDTADFWANVTSGSILPFQSGLTTRFTSYQNYNKFFTFVIMRM